MAPNLQNGEIVLSNHTKREFNRGDVIIFDATHEDPNIRPYEQYYVKRVIAKAGDTVAYSNGQLFVNGKLVPQSYIDKSAKMATGEWDTKSLSKNNSWQSKDKNKSVVPKNSYFVLGDNRAVSNDSRYYGYVQADSIDGEVIAMPWTAHASEIN